MLLSLAIIGAGIGGTTCAYFLRQLFGPDDDDLDLTIFEMGPVGGRLANIEMGGWEFECGGSIIHPANKLMKELTQVAGENLIAVNPTNPTLQ